MKFEQCQLNDVLAGVIDYRGKTPTKTESGIRLVTAKVIKKGRVINDGPQEYIHPKTYDEVMRRGVPERNDIFITTEASLGELALWDSDEQIAIAQRVILLRPDPKNIDTQYLFYHLKSIGFQAQLHANATGKTVPGIKNPVLRSLIIRFPHIDQQREIGQILSNYDGLIETNRRRIALLEESARLLYREWFVNLRFPGHESVKRQDGLPEGWQTRSVGDMASFLNRGITPKYDDTASGFVINQKCIRDGRLNLAFARRQSKGVKPERLVQLGDVLINSTGAGTLGRVAQIRSEITNCTVDTHLTIVRPLDIESFGYIGIALLELESLLSTMGKGATNQLELGRAEIAALSIIEPSPSVRKEFHRFVWPIFSQIENLLLQNIALMSARDELLPKLMSGTIQV